MHRSMISIPARCEYFSADIPTVIAIESNDNFFRLHHVDTYISPLDSMMYLPPAYSEGGKDLQLYDSE